MGEERGQVGPPGGEAGERGPSGLLAPSQRAPGAVLRVALRNPREPADAGPLGEKSRGQMSA